MAIVVVGAHLTGQPLNWQLTERHGKLLAATKTKPEYRLFALPNSTPPKPHPKAVFHGVNGTGTGGNGADDYKPGGNQGIAGGHGDQGAPGGDPNSTNYTGGGHGNGIAISRGLAGRNIANHVSFTGDFNENAKVAIDVRVDENGNVTSAEYQLRGSTTSAETGVTYASASGVQCTSTRSVHGATRKCLRSP